MTILDVRGVSHHFYGLHVLRGVNFDVQEGTITGLIGPNGAGKSTLFNIVSGFLRPSAGDIHYRGERITGQSIQQRSYGGLVRTFQTPQVFAHLSVHENLLAGWYKKGTSGLIESFFRLPRTVRELKDAAIAADEICEQFGLVDIKNERAGRLPAGQQRLVELARAVIGQPRLLCLDEPSSGLGSQEVVELMQALDRLHAKGITVLLVSHDMQLMRVSSIIHVLCFGEIIASGSMSELQTDPRVREAYLGA